MRSRSLPLLGAAAVIVGVAGEAVAYGWERPGGWVPDLITGWTLIGCGLAAWCVRPASRAGPLLTAVGFAWFAGNFSAAAVYLHRGPLVHLLLSYPGEAPAPRRARIAIVAGYGAAVVPAIWRSEVAAIALSVLLIAVAVAVHAAALGRERRAGRYALASVAILAFVLIGAAAARLAAPTQATIDATLLAYEVTLCALAAALLAGLVWRPWERAPMTDLVVELSSARSGVLRDALAHALGDPTLEVGYRVGDGYVEANGRPLALPAPGSARRVTPVERDGEPIAVLVHDAAVLDDPGLVHALATAARLAASNARLQAEVRVQLAELSASRRRLLEAADEERRRLERRLGETVERRLAALARTLECADASTGNVAALRQAEDQVARTRAELRELAGGLHPGDLDEAGLAGALASLTARSPVATELDVTGAELPEAVATAAYFVCAEALSNVIKYAGATRVLISVSAGARFVRVVVDDDGAGGAVPAGGLRGLTDRLEALGGTLAVDSPPGRGTRVIAELPLDGQAR